MNKRGLGRGLDALLGSASSATESLTEIPVDQIDANPRQPRKAFDPTSLDELARSLKSAGMIQPVVVRRRPGGRWQLIAGERRWRPARRAGRRRLAPPGRGA